MYRASAQSYGKPASKWQRQVGKSSGRASCRLIVYWGHTGIMEKKMETTI